MRGKLLMQQQMINDAMLRPQFFCEFDELEYDSVENRIILQALTIVQRTSKSNDIRMRSMDFAQRLSGQVTKTIVTKPERQRIMQSYNRQNLRYQPIHTMCEKIIEESGIGDIYSGDTSYVAPVFYNMNEYFERFVQKLFEQCYEKTGFEVELQLSEPAWTGEGDLGPRRMRPDITIWDGKICKYILDVKYKTKNISSGDLYQLGFYMHEFSEMNPTSVTSTEIKKAYAITPEYKDMAYGTYESQTKRQVVVKRINLTKCLDIIKHNNFEKIREEIKKAKGNPEILFKYLCDSQ
jgi:5-methylcytosine-specific restriction endonuclease McrBC regulatory subunit McrC